MKNINLDNLTGQEIRELVVTKEIEIEILDKAALSKLLDHETDLLCFGIGNMELISKCAELLERSESDPLSTEAHFDKIIEKAKSDNIIISNETGSELQNIRVDRKRKINIRKIWIVAATIAVLLSIGIIITTAFDGSVSRILRSLTSKPAETVVETADMSIKKLGKSRTYYSVDEFVDAEDISILYPEKMPEGFEVKRISINDTDLLGDKSIQIITGDPEVCILINTNLEETDSKRLDSEIYVSNGRTFYIRKIVSNATFFHNGDHYSVQADSYENLILILDNLKEH